MENEGAVILSMGLEGKRGVRMKQHIGHCGNTSSGKSEDRPNVSHIKLIRKGWIKWLCTCMGVSSEEITIHEWLFLMLIVDCICALLVIEHSYFWLALEPYRLGDTKRFPLNFFQIPFHQKPPWKITDSIWCSIMLWNPVSNLSGGWVYITRNSKEIWQEGFLIPRSMVGGMTHLKLALWEHVLI